MPSESIHVASNGEILFCGWVVFQWFSETVIYCFPQWLYKFTFSPAVYRCSFTPHPHCLLCVFLMMALLTGVKVIPHCDLIYVSLIISIVKHLVMYLLATHILSFENICLGLLLTFDRVACCCFFLFLISCFWAVSIFWILTPCQL